MHRASEFLRKNLSSPSAAIIISAFQCISFLLFSRKPPEASSFLPEVSSENSPVAKKKPSPGRRAWKDESMAKKIGDRIRTLRENRGMTRAQLAGLCNVHATQIHRYENGTTSPTAERIVTLSHALRVSPDALLRDDPKTFETPAIRNVLLQERLERLDELPQEAIQTAVEVLDAIITRYRIAAIAERRAL